MRILGISCFYHDAAAALIEDGEIIAAAMEERFSRKKHDSGFPTLAVNFCLNRAGIKVSDLNWVVFYEKPFLKFERITLSSLATVPYGRGSFVNAYKTWLKDKLWVKSILAKETGVSTKKILFTGHHLTHAAASYFTSAFKSAALLTVDGVGEWTTTAWGRARENKISLEKEIRFPHSLGLFYSTFTQFLGFRVNDGEFKVMGLAPYGRPIYKEKVEKLIHQSADGSFLLDLSYFNYHKSDKLSYNQKFVDLFGPPQTKEDSDKVQQKYADLAASVQEVLNDKLLVIAKYLREVIGEENLCYGGGVALNGVTNWEIFTKAGFKDVFNHPAAGDDGGALGAALYVYHHVLGKAKSQKSKFESVFLGEENKTDDIRRFLETNGIKSEKLSRRDLVEAVATLLASGKVIGWVQGRFEWGPRALGNRSILADPRSKKMKDIVNAKIKFREAFRPFAPVATWESAPKYFEVEVGRMPKLLEYMNAVVPVRKEYRQKLGATTHVDGSSRPQFIRRSVNPLYYELVKAFGKKTGLEVLLNTSFNLKGEPIVNTFEEAYCTFMKSGLDFLVLGNYLIKK